MLIEPWRGNLREVIAGAVAWVRQNTDWEFSPLFEPVYDQRVIERFPSVAGYFIGYQGPLLAAAVATGKPVVKFEGEKGTNISSVRSDNHAVATMALDHFAERGLKRLAVAGARDGAHGRLEQFRAQAHQRGYELHEQFIDRLPDHPDRHEALRAAWGPWLRSLPKPIGLFCTRAVVAQDVVFAAHLEDIAVPEQVAVLGTGANDLECEMCTPPLSAVDTGSHRRGREMARLLDAMIRGEPGQSVVIKPRGIITRRSTDMLAIDNPDLAAALRHIRDHACQTTKINQLLEPIPMSRRSIEMGIKQVFGRTIHDEVIRIKMNKARELLAYSSMILPDIAERCGFAYASHLNRIFKQRVGMTPTEYRRQQGY